MPYVKRTWFVKEIILTLSKSLHYASSLPVSDSLSLANSIWYSPTNRPLSEGPGNESDPAAYCSHHWPTPRPSPITKSPRSPDPQTPRPPSHLRCLQSTSHLITWTQSQNSTKLQNSHGAILHTCYSSERFQSSDDSWHLQLQQQHGVHLSFSFLPTSVKISIWGWSGKTYLRQKAFKRKVNHLKT